MTVLVAASGPGHFQARTRHKARDIVVITRNLKYLELCSDLQGRLDRDVQRNFLLVSCKSLVLATSGTKIWKIN